MKTKENDADVRAFISTVKNKRRREDSLVVLDMMERTIQQTARMWGASIIGIDRSYYHYVDGSEGVICTIGFAPRAAGLAFYISTKFDAAPQLLQKLGKHKFGAGGCLYINKLADVDVAVLEKIIDEAYRFGKR